MGILKIFFPAHDIAVWMPRGSSFYLKTFLDDFSQNLSMDLYRSLSNDVGILFYFRKSSAVDFFQCIFRSYSWNSSFPRTFLYRIAEIFTGVSLGYFLNVLAGFLRDVSAFILNIFRELSTSFFRISFLGALQDVLMIFLMELFQRFHSENFFQACLHSDFKISCSEHHGYFFGDVFRALPLIPTGNCCDPGCSF